MIDQAALLARLQADRQAVFRAIEGVPDQFLIWTGPDSGPPPLDILAYITAWDGETLRRIAYASGQSSHRPYDVSNKSYWEAWSRKQVEMKRLLGPRGIKVDLAGTWARLVTRLESLTPAEYTRWLEFDPRLATERPDLAHAEQLQRWRVAWERSLPWWQRLRRRWWSR
jgi:hypothetical protein